MSLQVPENSSSDEEDKHYSRRRLQQDDSSSNSSDDEDLAFVRRRRREKDLQDRQQDDDSKKRGVKRSRLSDDEDGHHAAGDEPFGGDEQNDDYEASSYHPNYAMRRPSRGGYRGRGGRGGGFRGNSGPPYRGSFRGRGGPRGRGNYYRGGSDGPRGGFKRRRFNYSQSAPEESDVESEHEQDEEQTEYMKSIRNLITTVGDQPKHIRMLTQVLIEDVNGDRRDDEVRDPAAVPSDSKIAISICSVLLDCVLKVPFKVPIYATLVGLLNSSNSGIVKFFISRVLDALKDSVTDCDWRKSKLLLRFLNELMNSGVITVHSVLGAYENFLDEIRNSSDETDESQTNATRDTFVYIILGSLPWGSAKIQEEDPAQLTTILNTIGRYMYRRSRIIAKQNNALFHVFQEQPTSESEYRRDYLSVMWNQFSGKPFYSDDQMDESAEDGYEEEENFLVNPFNAIYSPYKFLEEDLGQQEVQNLKIECNRPANVHVKLLKGRLGLYESLILSDAERNAAVKITKDILPSPADLLIIEEYISDFLHMTYLDSHRDSLQLLYKILPDAIYHGLKYTTKGQTTEETDEEDEVLKQKATKIADYILVDSLLGHMFIIPLPPVRLQYYRTILTDMASVFDARHSQADDEKLLQKQKESRLVIDSFINKCFELIPEMDAECVTNRFALFFANYLSQSNYSWEWDNWRRALTVSSEQKWQSFMRQAFVRQVLSFIYRLSSMTDVHRCIQIKSDEAKEQDVIEPVRTYAFIQPFIPHTSVPYFKYAENTDHGDTVPYVKQAQEILSAMKAGMKASDITLLVNKQLETVGRTTMMEIFMHSLLLVSSKSLSQLQHYLDMYAEAITDLMEDKEEMDSEVKRQRQQIEMQCVITKSVWQYWKTSPQFCVITLQKLLMFDKSMLSMQSIVSFIFQNIDDQNIKQSESLLAKYFHVWEVLRCSLEAVVTRSVRAKQSNDDALFSASVSEIQETVLFLIKKYVQVLLVAPDEDDESEWRTKCIWSHLMELIRRWQRFVPLQFDTFTAFIMDKYKSQLSSPQLSELSNVFKQCKYYRSQQISSGVETQADTEAIIQVVLTPNEILNEALEQMKEDTYIYNFLHQSEFTI